MGSRAVVIVCTNEGAARRERARRPAVVRPPWSLSGTLRGSDAVIGPGSGLRASVNLRACKSSPVNVIETGWQTPPARRVLDGPPRDRRRVYGTSFRVR